MTRDQRAEPFDRTLIVPDRVRRIEGSFAFVPHRFLRDGFWASLSRDELLLYLLLVLVADRQGMSFYYDDRLASMLRLVLDRFVAARTGIVRRDLIVHDPAGPRYQVLSLPERPVLYTTSSDRQTSTPRPAAPSSTGSSPSGRPSSSPHPVPTPHVPNHIRVLLRDFIARMDDPQS